VSVLSAFGDVFEMVCGWKDDFAGHFSDYASHKPLPLPLPLGLPSGPANVLGTGGVENERTGAENEHGSPSMLPPVPAAQAHRTAAAGYDGGRNSIGRSAHR
jgi:hypothetical protein